MKVIKYVNEVNVAVGRVKELSNFIEGTPQGCNAVWRARTETILNLAMSDDDITSDDVNIIQGAIQSGTRQLDNYIY